MNSFASRRRSGLGTIARGAALPLRLIGDAWRRASILAEFDAMPERMRNDLGITLADVITMSVKRRRR